MQPSPGNLSPLMRFMKYNLWGVLWGLLIILLTVLPGSAFPRLPEFMDLLQPDKLVHVFIFAVYFFLQARGFTLQDRFPSLQRRAVGITFLIGLTLGAGTELIQEFIVTTRSGNIYDFIADAAGCLAGWGALKLYLRKF
jgi:VanZ family protein